MFQGGRVIELLDIFFWVRGSFFCKVSRDKHQIPERSRHRDEINRRRCPSVMPCCGENDIAAVTMAYNDLAAFRFCFSLFIKLFGEQLGTEIALNDGIGA
jgi:hypothetical protein